MARGGKFTTVETTAVAVPSAGTAVRVTTLDLEAETLIVTAASDNTGLAHFGLSDVAIDKAIFHLSPGEAKQIDVQSLSNHVGQRMNMSDFWCDVTTNADIVNVTRLY